MTIKLTVKQQELFKVLEYFKQLYKKGSIAENEWDYLIPVLERCDNAAPSFGLGLKLIANLYANGICGHWLRCMNASAIERWLEDLGLPQVNCISNHQPFAYAPLIEAFIYRISEQKRISLNQNQTNERRNIQNRLTSDSRKETAKTSQT